MTGSWFQLLILVIVRKMDDRRYLYVSILFNKSGHRASDTLLPFGALQTSIRDPLVVVDAGCLVVSYQSD